MIILKKYLVVYNVNNRVIKLLYTQGGVQVRIILYLSVAVIAIAFLILVLYLAKTLKSLQSTLDSVSQTLSGLENQLQGVTQETAQLLHKTNTLAENIQKKTENLDSVFVAVKNVGTSIQGFNTTLQKVSAKAQNKLDHNEDKIAQIIQWSSAIMELRDRWKTKNAYPEQANAGGIELQAQASDNLPKKRFLRSRY